MTTHKIALVTGGNKGLGLEIARQLGQQGVTILLGARDAAKGQQAAAALVKEGFKAEFLQLDVESDAEIAAAVKTVTAKYGKLDILVNNAGVSTDWGQTPISRDSFAKTLNINLIGPWAVTQAFAGLLEASGQGRVVNHSSILGSIGTLKSTDQMDAFFTSAYSTSKAALNMLTVIQAKALAGKKIKVNAAHPGWVKTDLGGESAPMEIVDGAKTAVALSLLGEDGPSGGYFHLGKPLSW